MGKPKEIRFSYLPKDPKFTFRWEGKSLSLKLPNKTLLKLVEQPLDAINSWFRLQAVKQLNRNKYWYRSANHIGPTTRYHHSTCKLSILGNTASSQQAMYLLLVSKKDNLDFLRPRRVVILGTVIKTLWCAKSREKSCRGASEEERKSNRQPSKIPRELVSIVTAADQWS